MGCDFSLLTFHTYWLGADDSIHAFNFQCFFVSCMISIVSPVKSCFIDSSHKRSKSAGHSLDFLKSEGAAPPSATAQCVGEHMTKEDEFYRPCPANTNPFRSYVNLSGGQKIVSANSDGFDISDVALTLSTGIESFIHDISKQSTSLPTRLISDGVSEFHVGVRNSQLKRENLFLHNALLSGDECLSIDSAVETSSHISGKVSGGSDYSNCLNLECAMLFSGLDLIRMNKSRGSQPTNPTSDLESEFQDDLEDVLKSCSSSDAWSSEDAVLDHSIWSTGGLHSSNDDPSVSRYLHPTLVEKRRQLRHVNSKAKEKIDQLQIKLDQLKLQSKKKKRSN